MSNCSGSHFSAVDSDQYSLRDIVGKGSYGIVVQALDRPNDRKVAIKLLPNVTEDAQYTKRVVREISILHSMRHKNIVSLLDLKVKGKNLYIVTEYLESDLYKVIYDKKTHIRIRKRDDYILVLYQLLEAVKFLHSVGVLHRDIKPSNILLNANLSVKLCDFGFARVTGKCTRGVLDKDADPLTQYIVTRWYRAPEVFLSPGRYGKAQDVWAVACSFCELVRRHPLFPGNTSVDQIKSVIEVLGIPTDQDLNFNMFPRAKTFVKGLEAGDVSLESSIYTTHEIHPHLFDLLRAMLQFNPNRRITAEHAVELPIFKRLRGSSILSDDPVGWQMMHELSLERSKKRIDGITPYMEPSELLHVVHEEVSDISNDLENPVSDICNVSEYMNEEESKEWFHISLSSPEKPKGPPSSITSLHGALPSVVSDVAHSSMPPRPAYIDRNIPATGGQSGRSMSTLSAGVISMFVSAFRCDPCGGNRKEMEEGSSEVHNAPVETPTSRDVKLFKPSLSCGVTDTTSIVASRSVSLSSGSDLEYDSVLECLERHVDDNSGTTSKKEIVKPIHSTHVNSHNPYRTNSS